jgi:hypothetical protein
MFREKRGEIRIDRINIHRQEHDVPEQQAAEAMEKARKDKQSDRAILKRFVNGGFDP